MVNIDGLLDNASHRFNLIVPFWIFISEMRIDLHIEEYVIYIGNITYTVALIWRRTECIIITSILYVLIVDLSEDCG